MFRLDSPIPDDMTVNLDETTTGIRESAKFSITFLNLITVHHVMVEGSNRISSNPEWL